MPRKQFKCGWGTIIYAYGLSRFPYPSISGNHYFMMRYALAAAKSIGEPLTATRVNYGFDGQVCRLGRCQVLVERTPSWLRRHGWERQAGNSGSEVSRRCLGGIFLAHIGKWANTQHAVFALQRYCHTVRNMDCHERGHSDAKVHTVSVSQLTRRTICNLISSSGHGQASRSRVVRNSIFLS